MPAYWDCAAELGVRAAVDCRSVKIAAYMYRMAVEEHTLLAVIGEPYRQFMRTRKRLVPFVY